MSSPQVEPGNDPAERSENGTTLIVVGWMCWMFMLLVLFFEPAARRFNKSEIMAWIGGVLGVVGLALNIMGYVIRKRA